MESGSQDNTPIPKNDIIKKSPYYRGSAIWNFIPQDIRTVQRLTDLKKSIYHMLMDSTLRTDFIIYFNKQCAFYNSLESFFKFKVQCDIIYCVNAKPML